MKNPDTDVKRILVVEDEMVVTQVCRRALNNEMFEVDIAVNGEVAQDMLRERNYDLCLIDIRMPVMNGSQLYQLMKEKYPEMVNRVIFTTGDVIGSDMQIFLKQVGRPFLPKPFTPDELRAVVKETLSRIEK